jgi:hypothetical protein
VSSEGSGWRRAELAEWAEFHEFKRMKMEAEFPGGTAEGEEGGREKEMEVEGQGEKEMEKDVEMSEGDDE